MVDLPNFQRKKQKKADMTFVSSVVVMALGTWHLNGSVIPSVHYVSRVGAGDGWCLAPGTDTDTA